MSEISVIGNAVVGTVRTAAPPSTVDQVSNVEITAPPVEGGVVGTTDCVEFSEQAQLLEKIHLMPAVRQDQIDVIKDAIASDTHLNNDKITTAFDRLIDDVAK